MIRSAVMILAAVFASACVRTPDRSELAKSVEASIAERLPTKISLPGAREERDEVVDALLAKPLTADAAVQIALARNPRIGRSLADLGIEGASVLSLGAPEDPQIDAEMRFKRGGEDPAIELGLSQSLTSLLYSGREIAIGRSQIEAAKLRAAGAVLDVVADVRASFHRHQAALQRLELAETILAASDASFRVAKALHEAGNIIDLVYYQELDLLEQARLARSRAEVASAESAERLAASMGLWGKSDRFAATPRLPDPPEQALRREEIERLAIERSVELAEARYRIAAATDRAGLANRQRFVPDIEIGVTANREEENTWEVGPTLGITLPIFDRGYGEVVRAEAERERAERDYESTAIAVRSAVRTIVLRTDGARARAQHYKQIILPLRARLLEETQAQLNAMQAGVFQLLQAKREQIQAAREYVDELERFWLAREDLDQLSRGRLIMSGERAGETTMETEPSGSGRGDH
jgi:outer membrane protein TolC